MRVVLLILVLVLAPFCAFFLWAWAVKIKQERKIASTLPSWLIARRTPKRSTRPVLNDFT